MHAESAEPVEKITFETAAAHACTDVPVVAPTDRAAEIRRALTARPYESATHVVVCEGRRFAGILRVEDALAAPEDATAASLMDPEPPVAAPGVDQEVAAWRAVRHGESALSVVDDAGRFVGLIPPHRLLAVLLSEHEEDLARLGGFLKQASLARGTGEESVRRRIWHRLPWLLVGLAGAVLAADIVGAFEEQLQARVILAFFVPGIVYLADAVGTQTETIVVRGLSVGLRMRQMVWRELFAGLAIGLVLALLSAPLLLWRWDDPEVALGVALSLFGACSTATLAAMVLPWLLDAVGFDPAFGSGPMATVIQDLVSILIYFRFVTWIVG